MTKIKLKIRNGRPIKVAATRPRILGSTLAIDRSPLRGAGFWRQRALSIGHRYAVPDSGSTLSIDRSPLRGAGFWGLRCLSIGHRYAVPHSGVLRCLSIGHRYAVPHSGVLRCLSIGHRYGCRILGFANQEPPRSGDLSIATGYCIREWPRRRRERIAMSVMMRHLEHLRCQARRFAELDQISRNGRARESLSSA